MPVVLWLQFRATCSLHCDSKSAGYYSDNILECLTVFCEEPVIIKVIRADLRLGAGNPEVVRQQHGA